MAPKKSKKKFSSFFSTLPVNSATDKESADNSRYRSCQYPGNIGASCKKSNSCPKCTQKDDKYRNRTAFFLCTRLMCCRVWFSVPVTFRGTGHKFFSQKIQQKSQNW